MDIMKYYGIKIIRSDRRTVLVEVGRDLSVVVRAPRRMRTSDIERFVNERREWIESHIALMRLRNEETARRRDEIPPLTDEEIRALAGRVLETIQQRVEYFAPLVGVDHGRITVRSQRSRWGSCSSQGNLSFNCLLMLAPPEVADYVVVHELCHRIEMNHSPRFWAEVARVMPDYGDRKKWLRENGGALIERLRK